ncbi:hypothetical protein ABZ752_22825 [Streptomyces roseifaciens]
MTSSATAARTVRPETEAGRAACAGQHKVFDRAQHRDGSGPAPRRDRLAAASICAACPLFSTCGFRRVERGRTR